MENIRIQDRGVIVSIIHRALVEVMTLKKANLPLILRRFSHESTHGYDPTEDYEDYKYRIAQGARFVQSEDGGMSLMLEDDELERTILDCIIPKESTAVEGAADIQTAPERDCLEEEQEGEGKEEEDMDAASTAEQEQLALANPEEAETFELSTEDEPQGEALGLHPRAYPPVDGSWRSLSLANPDFKFAVRSLRSRTERIY